MSQYYSSINKDLTCVIQSDKKAYLIIKPQHYDQLSRGSSKKNRVRTLDSYDRKKHRIPSQRKGRAKMYDHSQSRKQYYQKQNGKNEGSQSKARLPTSISFQSYGLQPHCTLNKQLEVENKCLREENQCLQQYIRVLEDRLNNQHLHTSMKKSFIIGEEKEEKVQGYYGEGSRYSSINGPTIHTNYSH